MKILKTLFLLICSIFFISCSDSDDFNFNGNSLKQTTWEGTELVTDGDQEIRKIDVVMQFFTSSAGQYILKEDGTEPEVYNFKYSIDGKMMNIKDGPLVSERTLLEFSKDKIVLEAFGSYKTTLTLYKKY